MFRSKGAAVTASVVAVVLAAVLGLSVGNWIVDRKHPTKGDVRAAAHSLVPPGFTVTSEKLDAYLAYSFFGDKLYEVDVEAEGVGTREQRMAAFREQALQSGWQPGTTDGAPYTRDGISGRFDVNADVTLNMTAAATRNVEPSYRLAVVLMAASAAVVGLGICLAWLLVPRRRRRR